MAERRGDWMQTYTGRQFWPLDPRPEDVDIEDIAHALSNICRFGGHSKVFYSVAQHSVLVAKLCNTTQPVQPLGGLLHDAAEAYIGDMVRPLKRSQPAFRALEGTILQVIAARFAMPLGFWGTQLVKHADNAILATEQRDVMGQPPCAWEALPLPLEDTIVPWPPDVAREQFLAAFEWYGGEA